MILIGSGVYSQSHNISAHSPDPPALTSWWGGGNPLREARLLPGSSHMPPEPRPFTIAAWRPEWAAFWSQASGVSINWAIANGQVWDETSFAANRDSIYAGLPQGRKG